MNCPHCGSPEVRVVFTAPLPTERWRRRVCAACDGVSWSHETTSTTLRPPPKLDTLRRHNNASRRGERGRTNLDRPQDDRGADLARIWTP